MVALRIALSVGAVCALAGCSLRGSPASPIGPRLAAPQFVAPDVTQKGKGAQWVQFLPHTTATLFSAMVAGPDANIWFLDENAASLVRITNGGFIKEFRLSAISGNAVSMAVGADHKFYILDESTSIVRATTAGASESLPIPSGDNTSIDGLTLGPDGNVWFAEFNHIAKVTPAGKITEFSYPKQPGTNQYGGVTTGSDGNIWFAQSSQNAIGRIVPSTGKITMFPIAVSCAPAPVVLGKDKNVWFACLTTSPMMGRVTPRGNVETFAIGGVFNSNETEQFCSRGPDGEPWCASGNDNTVFRVNTATHTTTTFTPPLASGDRPDALVAGPDGNIWVDTVGPQAEIDVLVANPMTVTPNSLTFTAPGQSKTVTVNENGTTSWTAKSSKTSVATVMQGSSKSTFKVTAAGVGTCKITISDPLGNSAAVRVKVT
jgi:streptogramin lyase